MPKGGARPNSGPKVDPLGYLVPFTLRIPSSMNDELIAYSKFLASECKMTSRQIHREFAKILIRDLSGCVQAVMQERFTESMKPPSQR